MIGKTDPEFWPCFEHLPREVQEIAREKYRVWCDDPFHRSLYFKELMPGIWSVRINMQYRALGRRRGETVVWFWIGSHAEYDRLIKR